jgi:hypothetical protein
MTLLEQLAVRPAVDPEALIKEARRLRRRRWLIGLCVLIAAAAIGTIVGVASRGSSPPARSAAPTLPLRGTKPPAVAHNAPDACGLLSNAEASTLLRAQAVGKAYTSLGFPVSSQTPATPTYSQCRYTSQSTPGEIRLFVNASPANAPSFAVIQRAAAGNPGDRILTIDGSTAVWQPWAQQNLQGQGGSLDSVKKGDFVELVLVYVASDPAAVANDAMRLVLSRI